MKLRNVRKSKVHRNIKWIGSSGIYFEILVASLSRRWHVRLSEELVSERRLPPLLDLLKLPTGGPARGCKRSVPAPMQLAPKPLGNLCHSGRIETSCTAAISVARSQLQ